MKTVEFQGLKIKLDRPKGFVMKGKDKDGKEWTREYQNDYGFLPKTEGGDGSELDVFLGPDPSADEVFWITQNKEDGSFDEYKTFLGFHTKAEAKKVYEAHIPRKFFGGIVAMKMPMFKALLGKDPLEKTAFVSFCSELAILQGAP